MNVQDFVSESLRQLNAGVRAVKDEKGIIVSPQPLAGRDNTAAGHMLTSDGYQAIMLLEFDLSVTVQSTLEGKAGADLTVLGVGGKGDISSSIDQTRVQRIKFQIPVAFTPHAP
jgi:hypothetical protein